MRDQLKHFPVNWMDGMKINKNHFIAQDNASHGALQDATGIGLSPLRYGVLPPSASGESTFRVPISTDNQNTVRIAVLACDAVTAGGARITIPVYRSAGQPEAGQLAEHLHSFSNIANESSWWVVLTVHPFMRQPSGSPDLSEMPVRFPHVLPTYEVEVVSDNGFLQYAHHPYALAIGKILVSGGEIIVDKDYIPPCYTVASSPDLLALHAELDQFLANLEMRCSQIVQKIFKKSQQNELSDLVMFLCDRVMLYLGQSITSLRWLGKFEAPVAMFVQMAALARVMKNSIDLRIGTGKDELMSYFSDWCELKQGELESLLISIVNMDFDNNDVNRNIQKTARFVSVVTRLFDTLSKLEYIGKRKEPGIFVKEESLESAEQQAKTKRRFFG
jgi:hypothetical protein